MEPITYNEICAAFPGSDSATVETRMRLDDMRQAGKLSREAFDFIREREEHWLHEMQEAAFED